MDLTGGAGVDVAIEAVGVPATFDICQAILAPGGRLANVGVHGKPVTLHLEKLWDRNITLTTRLVDTVTTPMLLKVVQSGRLQPGKLVTHRFALADIMKAYDTFGTPQQRAPEGHPDEHRGLNHTRGSERGHPERPRSVEVAAADGRLILSRSPNSRAPSVVAKNLSMHGAQTVCDRRAPLRGLRPTAFPHQAHVIVPW